MLKTATYLFVACLFATAAHGSESLTGQIQAQPAADGGACFSQTLGTCDGGTFVSAIVSQLNTSGANCGTYSPPPPMNRTADEFQCDGPVDTAKWWGTYFGAGWDPALCPALGAAADFNLIFILGGTPCPDDLFVLCNLANVPAAATDLGSNDWEYEANFACALIPPATPVFFTAQINEDAYPQWGWGESADNAVGGFPCLIAPGFGINDWTDLPGALGAPWCGQAFEMSAAASTPVEGTSWGAIKGTFVN